MLATQICFGETVEDRRQEIIKIINEELSEVYKLSQHLNHRNPDHLLRMAELNLEKARLYREKENKDYLALSSSQRRKTTKNSFFKTSRKYYSEADKLCMRIVSNYPNYREIGNVYYIIAFNAKEENNDKKAEQYFKKAVAKTPAGSKIRYKSMISLAEIYYNTKRYSKAIPLYESALAKYKDRWWTKDSYNLAWCYYRSNMHSRAINKLLEVYKVSKDIKYEDMSYAVERDIGQVYATSGRISDGIKFYEAIGINFTEQLLEISDILAKEGRKTEADKVLKYAQRYVKDDSKRADVYLQQQEQSLSFDNFNQHLSATTQLMSLYKAGKLDSDQTKKLAFQIKKVGAILQKKVVSNTFKGTKTRNIYKNWALKYFDDIKEIEKENLATYSFYQGETAYAVGDYKSAMGYYSEAFDVAKKSNNSSIQKNAMEGLLSSLGQKRLPFSVKNAYYIPVYKSFLEMEPISDRAEKLHSKLFKIYLDKGDFDNAEATLISYHKNFPKNHTTHEAMIANLMELSKKRSDHTKIREWVKRVDAGEYVVSAPFKLKLQQLLTNIQIEEVQTKLDKGNKKEALVGYHKIVVDPYSTKNSKINAKYNLAALYYELGDVDRTLKWSIEALDEMDSKNVIEFSDSFLSISSFLFGMQYFKDSAKLSEKVLEKMCTASSKKKNIAFKNSLYLYVAEDRLKDAQRVLGLGRTCKVKKGVVVEATFEIIDKFYEHKLYDVYEQSIHNLSFNKKYWPKLVLHYTRLIDVHEKHQNISRAGELKQKRAEIFSWCQRNKKTIPISALNAMAMEEARNLPTILSNLKSTKLTFPENTFNEAMKRKLKLLEMLSDEAVKVQKLGAPEGIVYSFKALIDGYEEFVNEIKAFKPDGKSKEFLDSFNKAMAGVYVPLEQKVVNFKRDAKSAIVKNDILSDLNGEVIYDRNASNQFFSPYKGVIMHKGGKR